MDQFAQNTLKNPLGSDLCLERYPKDTKLQAWDASDELILENLKNVPDLGKKKILIMQDSFGALSISLKDFNTTTYTDSYVSYHGINQNFKGLKILNDLEKLKGPFDLVIVKLPKNLSFLEDILAHLSKILPPKGDLIIGAMVKHLTNNIFNLVQEYIGPTTTSLAKKKARLIFTRQIKPPQDSPYPQKVDLEVFEDLFLHHSNIFSRNKLDIGTRFFLEHIPTGISGSILDLGCANGAIGIKAKILNPTAKIIFSDESYMAIKSAEYNYNKIINDSALCKWTHSYVDQDPNNLDLILCNPPFHQNHIIGDFISAQMFSDSKKALKNGGILRVIGNTHLGYHQKLKKLFGNSKIIAKNKKFIINEAVKLSSN